MIDLMDERVVRSILETMPAEITVIDAKDEVIGWNKDETRIFKRAESSLQLNFRSCHPKESLRKVEQIVEEMKSSKRDEARFWIDLPLGEGGAAHKVLIEFFALRDRDGSYLGCLEYTRDIEDERHLEGEHRLLD
jgi:PAS domain S-box-containing protein